MARLNIEDSLFTDSRFQFLVEKIGRHAALGVCVQAFMAAQQFFLNEDTDRMIPLKEWKKRMLSDLVIEAGLAEIRDNDLVYVEGSVEQFSWLIQKQEAGRKGGLAKASESKRRLAAGKRRLASSSSSSSSSISKNNTNTITPLPAVADSDLENIYSFYPKKAGKAAGMRLCKKFIVSHELLTQLSWAVNNYRHHLERENTEPRFIKYFSTFMGEWRDWTDPKHGTGESFVPTKKTLEQVVQEALNGSANAQT